MNYVEVETTKEFLDILPSRKKFEHFAFQNIDFSSITNEIKDIGFSNCLFLGCKFNSTDLVRLISDNDIFPNLELPYNQYPAKLYTKASLYTSYKTGNPSSYKQTYDFKVYDHFIRTGKESASISEELARRIHDHAITDALYDFLSGYDERRVVAIMGGHDLSRKSDDFLKVSLLSKLLCEKGYLMVSGGGPGAMEATHLGSWFAGRPESDLKEALKILCKAPEYQNEFWLDTALSVIEKYPHQSGFESLGIPTWLYGHEPSTPFATKIAKYFANSIREDGLLTIAKGGLIFTPGSAGTLQEIFQDATQNHYLVFGYSSPMIFYGKHFWMNEVPVFQFLSDLLKRNKYKNLLISIHDEVNELVEVIDRFSGIIIPEA